MGAAAERLILFTRFPQAGQVKTRLIAALGADHAATLHRRLTEYALRQAHGLAKNSQVEIEVQFTGGDRSRMAAWLGTDLQINQQVAGNLGARMDGAFTAAFAAGAQAVVIMGSDCPGLSSQILQAAFTALTSCDLVLGPAADGGYYLIGLRRRVPELFQDIKWGSAKVLASTLDTAARLGLTCKQLPTLADVDRPEDVARVASLLSSHVAESS